MKRGLLLLISLIGLLTADFAAAEPEVRSCGGILHRDKYGLRFGRGPGEEEFICVINKSQTRKVLATCSVGKYCEVVGLVDACEDSGECVEVTNITSVTTKPRR